MLVTVTMWFPTDILDVHANTAPAAGNITTVKTGPEKWDNAQKCNKVRRTSNSAHDNIN